MLSIFNSTILGNDRWNLMSTSNFYIYFRNEGILEIKVMMYEDYL